MSDARLIDDYDCLMLDLDGVVYVGSDAVPGAPDLLASVRDDVTLAYVTNNASRTPDDVAEHLQSLGITCTADDVVTSAQAAAREIGRLCAPEAKVLVVGGRGLEVALIEEGFVPVRSADDAPVAVVQGFAQELGWKDLAEAAYALADADVVWVASNTDLSIPTERGHAPGNGTLVAAVEQATGRRPDSVAGKPHRPVFDATVERVGARRPLVVGDRLDTDIAGGVACDADAYLVLTGVTDARGACLAPREQRPTYIAADLAGLLEPYAAAEPEDGWWTCDGWRAQVTDAVLRLEGDGEGIAGLRAAAAACWEAADADPDATLDVADVDRLPLDG